MYWLKEKYNQTVRLGSLVQNDLKITIISGAFSSITPFDWPIWDLVTIDGIQLL